MHFVSPTSLLLSCVAALPAQGPTLTLSTQTDFGVLVGDGTNQAPHGVPAQTRVGAGLDLLTGIRGVGTAHSSVTPAARGLGVVIQEDGSLTGSAMAMRLAGTTGNAGHGPLSPHTILMEIGGVRELDGIISVQWAGRAAGAMAGCAIDLDGDQRPEFAAHATGTPVTIDLPIHRSGDRFQVWITTSAVAHLMGAGTAGYGAQLNVLFRAGGGGGGCALTPYGDECAGRLAGRITPNGDRMDLNLVLTGSLPSAFGLLLVGPTQARVSLGTCLLLVEPAVAHLFSTDAQGGATHLLRVPGGQQIQAYLQDLVLDLTPPRVVIGTSNGLTLGCR